MADAPTIVTGGVLSDIEDQDWFAITATNDDIGKSIHVVTMAGDPRTDTILEFFAADGTTSLGGPAPDRTYHEDWTSTAITEAGVYYIKISASPDYDEGSKNYLALIELVDTPVAPN